MCGGGWRSDRTFVAQSVTLASGSNARTPRGCSPTATLVGTQQTATPQLVRRVACPPRRLPPVVRLRASWGGGGWLRRRHRCRRRRRRRLVVSPLFSLAAAARGGADARRVQVGLPGRVRRARRGEPGRGGHEAPRGQHRKEGEGAALRWPTEHRKRRSHIVLTRPPPPPVSSASRGRTELDGERGVLSACSLWLARRRAAAKLR